jgi:AbrB family looped-hinge helix DNA binding protein
MNASTLTSKGQVTIPAAVRAALDLASGDRLIFTVEGERLIVTPVRRRRLSDLRGSLPATRPYSGLDEVRTEVGQQLGAALERSDAE